MIRSFRELRVYQKAFDISLDIHKFSKTLPKDEQFSLADQLRRASKSICANIAEGFGRQKTSRADFKRFLLMSIGSCNEMLVWIDYCKALNYADQKTCEKWNDEYTQILKMLTTLHSKS